MHEEDLEVNLNAQTIPKRDNFKYLVSLILESIDINDDLTYRIRITWMKKRLPFGVVFYKKVPPKFKDKLHKVVVN